MERKKICIGIPCYSTVAAETLEDYMRFSYMLGRRYQIKILSRIKISPVKVNRISTGTKTV